MKQLTTALITEKNKLDTVSAWLNLIQLNVEDATTLYYVANHESVTFDGILYSKINAEISQSTADSKGGIHDLEITVQNVDRIVQTYIEQYDMRGRRARIIQVNSANLGDANAYVSDVEYEIISIQSNQFIVTFTLGHIRLVQQRFPNGLFLRDNCRWIYKSTECGFVDDTHVGFGTISSSGTAVTGTDTKFLLTFKNGDSLKASGQTRIVSSVSSNTALVVTSSFSPDISNQTYTIIKPTCALILGGDNGCSAHFGLTGAVRFGAYPSLPVVYR